MRTVDELTLSKDLISFQSITPVDAGAINFLAKKLRSLGFKCQILEFKKGKGKPIKNLYAKYGNKQPNLCFSFSLSVIKIHFQISFSFSSLASVFIKTQAGQGPKKIMYP